jgi:hypothetical protein
MSDTQSDINERLQMCYKVSREAREADRKEYSALRVHDVMDNAKKWNALLDFMDYHFHDKRGMKEFRALFQSDSAEI